MMGLREDEVIIGRVVSVRGPMPQLRVKPDGSHPERFGVLQKVTLVLDDGRRIELGVAASRTAGEHVVLDLEKACPASVFESRGAVVVVPCSERFPLPANEYYVNDVVGLEAILPDGRRLGKVVEVYHTSANDIFRVVDSKGKETLIPAVKEAIGEISIAAGTLTVRDAALLVTDE